MSIIFNDKLVCAHPALPQDVMIALEAVEPSWEVKHWRSLDDEGRGRLVSRINDHTLFDCVTYCHECTYQNSNQSGYPLMMITFENGERRNASVVRINLVRHGIPVPAGFYVDHVWCKNTLCINPAHVELVTPKVHVARNPNHKSKQLKRRTHCNNNHEFNVANTYYDKNGARRCRACRRIDNI